MLTDEIGIIAFEDSDSVSEQIQSEIEKKAGSCMWTSPSSLDQNYLSYFLSHPSEKIRVPTKRGSFDTRQPNNHNIEKILRYASSKIGSSQEFIDKGRILLFKLKENE